MPFTIVQITDPHIGAAWSPEPIPALADAVAAVRVTLPAVPDAVVVSGDIANTPSDAEYARARALLEELDAPIHVLPGNHDDRAMLRRHFDLPDTHDGSVSYATDLGPIRLVALDSTRPGSAAGQLDGDTLTWLERTLGKRSATPTLLAMHHPPLAMGIPAMDAIGLPKTDRRSLGEIVARHRQVRLIAAGHVHRLVVGELRRTTVLAIPGTAAQLALDFAADDVELVGEPPCFALHLLVDDQIVSHVQPVTTGSR